MSPAVEPNPLEVELELIDRRVPGVNQAVAPQHLDLLARAAREQHLRGGAAVEWGPNPGGGTAAVRVTGAAAPVYVDDAPAIPGREAHGQPLTLGEVAHDGTRVRLELARAQQHRRECHGAPSKLITAMAHALEQADPGQARQHVVGKRLPDPEALRGRGHPPLGLLGSEQVENRARSRQRT